MILQNTSVRNKMLFVIGAGAVAMLIMGFIVIKNFFAVQEDWSEYVKVLKVKQDHLMNVRSTIGYGGAIHKFKNYVLRGKLKDFNNYMVKANAVRESIFAYKALGSLTPTESSALDKVVEMVEKYRNAIGTARSLLKKGKTVKEIDEVTAKWIARGLLGKRKPVKEIDKFTETNDSFYLEALAALSKELDQKTRQRTEALTSRIQNLKTLFIIIIPLSTILFVVLAFLILMLLLWLSDDKVPT